MDASIMDGTTGSAGAVANVSNIKNPIKLARTVADDTQHVLLCGTGASSLAPKHDIQVEDNHYFFTEERYAQLKNARLTNSVVLDHGGAMLQDQKSVGLDSTGTVASSAKGFPKKQNPLDKFPKRSLAKDLDKKPDSVGDTTDSVQDTNAQGKTHDSPGGWAEEHKFGTVGCVARDQYGNLAAAGSTGGLTNKHPGRIGDTPIIGAGVYANTKTCAVACTGQGETFIKHCVAHDVHARIKYLKEPLAMAIDEVILNVLPPETGGMIGVDAKGHVHASYNTAGMFTGLADYAGRYETWHNVHEESWTQLNIVPDILDEFAILGLLKIWFLQKTGAVSRVHLDVSSGRRLRTTQCMQRPDVFFAGPGHNSHPCLHTLLMISADQMAGEPKLTWLVVNIPNAEVSDGEEMVTYKGPNEKYDALPSAARFASTSTHHLCNDTCP